MQPGCHGWCCESHLGERGVSTLTSFHLEQVNCERLRKLIVVDFVLPESRQFYLPCNSDVSGIKEVWGSYSCGVFRNNVVDVSLL